ncbi:MAG: GNAT family N-acetyltransferase [Candidatus Sulfotelmatobacter sp.]
MRVVVLRKIPEEPSLLRQWDDLVLQMERPEVFYTSEWALAVQSAYQASLKPLLLLGYDGDHLAGVACLATDANEQNVSFLAATTADYCDFLSHPQRRAEFVDKVFAELCQLGAGNLVLASLPADSATPAALHAAAEKHRFHLYMRPACLCVQVELGSAGQRREIKSALAGKKKLRRYLRTMEREGPVTFAHLQSEAEIHAALPEFMNAHVARFRSTHRISVLSTPERRFFLEELTRRFSGSQVVTLSMLVIGDRPVAWNYGFQFHGSWFWYQPTFDSRQEENSPGQCLLLRIVTEACDMNGIKEVDLGLGAEGYKDRFGNSTRQTLDVALTKSWSRHLHKIVRYRAASALKRSPKVESAVRRLLRRLRPTREVTPGTKSI